jgi:hypothetical protein
MVQAMHYLLGQMFSFKDTYALLKINKSLSPLAHLSPLQAGCRGHGYFVPQTASYSGTKFNGTKK